MTACFVFRTFTVYCREMRDPLKCHITCFYQLAFNASEFEKKLRANNRFLVALQAALMEMPGGVSFAGTDGQIFKCAESAPTNSAGDDLNSNKKSGSGVGGERAVAGSDPTGVPRGSARISGRNPRGLLTPKRQLAAQRRLIETAPTPPASRLRRCRRRAGSGRRYIVDTRRTGRRFVSPAV